jgi:hypothetical protein
MSPVRPPAGTVLPLTIVNDHLLLDLDGEISLIDTGAPASMRAPELVAQELGTRVDWILGVDWIADGALTIDWPARQVVLGEPASAGEVVALRPSSGLWQIEVAANGGSRWAFLDTGAQLSYAPPAACEELAPIARRADFYPMIGRFELDVYRIPVRVGSREIIGTFGVLPPLLLTALTLVGEEGWILGSDFFRDRRIVLELEQDRLVDCS